MTRLGLSLSSPHKLVTCKLSQQGMAVAAVWACPCLHAASLMQIDTETHWELSEHASRWKDGGTVYCPRA